MKRPRHSYSRLNTFTSICERRYYLDAVSPRQPETPAMARGSQFHAIMEGAAERVTDGWDWPNALHAAALITNVGPLMEVDRLKYAYGIETTVGALVPRNAELWFDTVEDLPVVGKIDLLSDTCSDGRDEPCVIDYKTTARSDKIPSQWMAQRSLQLRIYCLATGVKTAAYIYVLPNGTAHLVEATYSSAELDQAMYWLRHTVQVIEGRWGVVEDFKVHDGGEEDPWALAAPDHPLCSKHWCPYFSECIGKVNPT